MAINATWDKLPTQLLLVIGQKLGSCEDFLRFSAVCKSWQSVLAEMRQDSKPLLLSPESPLLMLAEKVPEEYLLDCDLDVEEDGLVVEEDYGLDEDQEEGEEEDDEDMEENGDVDMEEGHDQEGEEEDDEDVEENEEGPEDMDTEGGQELLRNEEDHAGDAAEMEVGFEEYMQERYEEPEDGYHAHVKYTIGSVRGFYRLSSGTTYTVELPEAAGKLILGTNKGWVITLGEDFETSLLHPLLRQQIWLPSMRTFRVGNVDCSHDDEEFNVFIRKVFMSSTAQSEENVSDNDIPNPIIMTIYGKHGYLGFVRLGDKVWTKVDIPSRGFADIAYHTGYFFAINCDGDTYMFVINDSTSGEVRAKKIAECPRLPAHYDFNEKYLVVSGDDLWLVVRLRRVKLFKRPHHNRVKYRTTDFLVWKMEHYISRDGLRVQHIWVPRHNLGNQAFFLGHNSSVSIPSSGYIRPNCIYFTDDAWDLYYSCGGGHDVGVFDVASGTIAPVFQGKSIHFVSPPLWYI